MKKVLGWAVVAMLVGMVVYFGLLRIGMHSVPVALTVATVVAVTTVAVFDAFYAFVALRGVVAVVLVGFFSGILSAALAALFIAFGAYKVATKAGIDFKWPYIAYLIESVGVYGTLKLGLWEPAAGAALLLGIWWLATWTAEKFSPASI